MARNIEDIKAELAQAQAEETKKTGFTVVIFDKKTDDLKEIKVKAHHLTDIEKSEIMKAAGELGDNLKAIQEMSKELDSTVGSWLKFMALIDGPLKGIVSNIFKLDKEQVTTLPNIELLGLIFEENPWINSKAQDLSKELAYISNKNK